jgi:hypothetical protein
MKRQIFSYLGVTVIALLTVFTSCKKNDDIQVQNKEALSQIISADQTSGSEVTFTTTGAWTSNIKDKATKSTKGETWISINPDHGNAAGTYTVKINLEPNETGADRSAVITITCGDMNVEINVTQKGIGDNGDVRLLKTINFNYNSDIFEYVYATLEYDNQNRLTKVLDYNEGGGLESTLILTYSGNDLVKSDYISNSWTSYSEFHRNGNEITIVSHTTYSEGTSKIYMDNEGFPIRYESEHGTINYLIQNGNMIKQTNENGTETIYEYDNNKSPRFHEQTPKWYTMFYEFSEPHPNLRGNRNNMTRIEENGFSVRIEYEYDNKGYPTKSRAIYSDEIYTEIYTAEYIYENILP